MMLRKFLQKILAQYSTMENSLFLAHKDLKDNPFYERRVAYTGTFSMDSRVLSKLLKHWGAEVNNTISKSTKFVLIGNNPRRRSA